jgi:hypothetical protein
MFRVEPDGTMGVGPIVIHWKIAVRLNNRNHEQLKRDE